MQPPPSNLAKNPILTPLKAKRPQRRGDFITLDLHGLVVLKMTFGAGAARAPS
jgi:hypothetical protein